MSYYHDEYYCCFHEDFPGLDAIEQFKESERKNKFIEQAKSVNPFLSIVLHVKENMNVMMVFIII